MRRVSVSTCHEGKNNAHTRVLHHPGRCHMWDSTRWPIRARTKTRVRVVVHRVFWFSSFKQRIALYPCARLQTPTPGDRMPPSPLNRPERSTDTGQGAVRPCIHLRLARTPLVSAIDIARFRQGGCCCCWCCWFYHGNYRCL